MKILKPGREQSGWAIETTCTGEGNGGGGCGAVLLVEAADLYITSRDTMGRDYEEFATFQCPTCGVETDLSKPGKAIQIARENGRRGGAPGRG
jgi:hypothetical protein